MTNRLAKRVTDRFDIVNFLRVIATLFVFILHGQSFIINLSESSFFNAITTLPAWAGVWIFLFLSGYTVGLGFFKGRYPILSVDNRFSLKNYLLFCWGRFLKIAPFYYVYCFLWEIFSGNFYFLHSHQVLLKVLFFCFNGAGGIDGMGHLWYISTAMQMYLIMPFAYLLIRKLKTPVQSMVCFLLLLSAGLLLRLCLLKIGVEWYADVYTSFIGNIDLVVCGILIAFYKTQYAQNPHPNIKLRSLALITFFALVGYNVAIYINLDYSVKCLEIYRYWLPSFYILASALLIVYWGNINYRSEPFSFKAFLRNPLSVIDWFAPKTYAFYIFHIVALEYVEHFMTSIVFLSTLPAMIRIPVQYALAFVLALICSNLFSKISFRSKRKNILLSK